MEAIDYSHRDHRIDIDRFHRMIEAGVFTDQDRVELIEGEMLDMPPIGPRHGGTTAELNMAFAARLAGRAIVTSAGPLTLDRRNELYPDLSVLKARDDFYRHRNPGPEDALLVIEFSDSSLGRDLETKLPIYARSGIACVWILDIPGRQIHTFADPEPDSATYRQAEILSTGTLSIEIEGCRIDLDVADLFRT